jgi:hypothetical protein
MNYKKTPALIVCILLIGSIPAFAQDARGKAELKAADGSITID